jgi:hypothetical protein
MPDRVDVWTGEQSPQFGLLRAADELGVSPEKVFIHTATSKSGAAEVNYQLRPNQTGRARGEGMAAGCSNNAPCFRWFHSIAKRRQEVAPDVCCGTYNVFVS